MTTATNMNKIDSSIKIFDLIDTHKMSLHEILEQTDYTIETAYSGVVAVILTLSLAHQISEAYGQNEHVRAIEAKLIDIYADWIEISGGKLPISDIEKHPQDFLKAIEELKFRVSKQKR